MSKKNRPGRPSLGLSKTLTIHLTPRQHKWLGSKSKEYGLSMAMVLRQIIDRKSHPLSYGEV